MSKQTSEQELEKKLLGREVPTKPNTRWDARIGIIIIVAFVLIFGGWATLSPLESAAIAPGKVVVSGNRRVIQHLEGGIIKAVYVHNGSEVKKRQKLLQLEDTRAKVALEVLQAELVELAIVVERLKAEVDHAETFSAPSYLKKYYPKQEKIKLVYKNQQRIFKANLKAYHARIQIMEKKIDQLKEQLKGEQAQLDSLKRQQEISTTELKEIKILHDKRLVERSKLLNLQREQSRLAGQYGQKLAAIATIQQKIGETKQQKISFQDQTRKDQLKELRETEVKLADVFEKEKAANDVYQRTIIRSPQTGTVVGLEVHTIGQVIKPGEVLMEVVPKHEQLVVDAEVSPTDIDVVHKGLRAKVQLTAFQARTTPSLLGTVTHVSADAITDNKSGRSYYRAIVSIDRKELEKLGAYRLYPGMPAEVMIITDRLTPLEYFITPIQRSFDKAFREQ